MDFPNLMPQNYSGFVPNHAATVPSPATTADPAELVQGKKGGFLAALAARIAAFADRLETSHWQRSLRAREAYLAQAQNAADLENRMRELDGANRGLYLS